MAETFLSRLSAISAIEQQEGIPRERRFVRTDDLREMVYHFNRLDEHERSEYSEFKSRLMSQRKEIEAANALIERQAAEIERLNQTWPNSCDFKDDDGCCLFPGAMTPECHADACSVIKGLKQEIERLNKSLKFEQNYLSRVGTHAEGCYKWGPGHWDCAMREIAKRGRMLEKATWVLDRTGSCPKTCDLIGNICVARACWTEWLEKEAEEGKQ